MYENTRTNWQSVFYVNLVSDVIGENLKVSCDAFYIGKPKPDYCASVKFEEDCYVQQRLIQAIAMKGEHDFGGLSVIAQTKENTKEFCMYVPQRGLHLFVSKANRLESQYTFFTM